MLAGSTVTYCDAFSPPMKLALTSLPPSPTSTSRTLPSVCQVAGIHTRRKWPCVPQDRSAELAGSRRACPELWGTVKNMRRQEPGQKPGRNDSFPKKGSFQSSSLRRPRPQPVSPVHAHHQGADWGSPKGRGDKPLSPKPLYLHF